MLTRDAIFAHVDAVAATVTIPELSGEIGIRHLSFAEAMALASAGRDVDDSAESQEAFMVQLVVTCACDDAGQRLFEDTDQATVAKLPANALQRIADAALTANGLTGDAVEQAVGNSEATPDGGGSSS